MIHSHAPFASHNVRLSRTVPTANQKPDRFPARAQNPFGAGTNKPALESTRSGRGFEHVHQAGIGRCDAGEGAGASRRGFDLELAAFRRKREQKELPAFSNADRRRGGMMRLALGRRSRILNSSVPPTASSAPRTTSSKSVSEISRRGGASNLVSGAASRTKLSGIEVGWFVTTACASMRNPLLVVRNPHPATIAQFTATVAGLWRKPKVPRTPVDSCNWTIPPFVSQWPSRLVWEDRNAWTDAGMAAALPQDHRPRGEAASQSRNRVALDRRADRADRPTPRCGSARSRSLSGSNATAMGWATASPRWPGTRPATSRPGTASWASARSTTR